MTGALPPNLPWFIEHFIRIILLKAHTTPKRQRRLVYYLDVTDGKTEAQRGAETCSRSHSREQARLGCPAQAWCSLPDATAFPLKSLLSILELSISGGARAGAVEALVRSTGPLSPLSVTTRQLLCALLPVALACSLLRRLPLSCGNHLPRQRAKSA